MDGQREREVTELSRLIWAHFHSSTKVPPIEQVADDIGYTPSMLYKISEGERDMRLSDFPRFYRFSGKPLNILKYIIAKCDPKLALITVGDTDKINGRFDDEKDDLDILHGHTVEALRDSLSDGTIDDDERQRIVDEATEMIATLNRLVAEVNHRAAMAKPR